MIETPPLWMWVLGFLLVLGPLVTLHELGHYLVGRWCGVKADAFSVGFGKELLGYTDRRGTRWKLSVLPLGGYVQFAGDMNPASRPSEEWLALPPAERAQTFQARTLGQKALIVAAGPAVNFLVAIAILAGLNLAYGRLEVAPVVQVLAQDGAAAQAGIAIGDRIVSIDGDPIEGFDEVPGRIAPHPGEAVTMVVDRDGRQLTYSFTIRPVTEQDRFGNQFKIGQIGIGAGGGRLVAVGPAESVGLAVQQTGQIMHTMVVGLWQVISGRRSVEELGGPIKIAKFSGEQLSLGWPQFVHFAALISINLAFINLLPIPALDGGHLAFYAAEAIRRKPASQRSQEWAFRTGMAFVLALMLFVTINDVATLPIWGQ